MTPLSIRYKDTIAGLRAMLAVHTPRAIERLIPGPLTALALMGQRCAATLLDASTLARAHPVLPLLLDLTASLHLALRHVAANEADTQRRGQIQAHANMWQRLRVILVDAPSWTSWAMTRTDVAPMLDPVKSGLPANPFEAYHRLEAPAVLQSDDAQRALRALIYSDPVLRPLGTPAIGELARALVAGTTLKGLL